MKKIIFAFSTLLILGLLLTACSPPDKTTTPKKPNKSTQKESLHITISETEIPANKYQNKGYELVTFGGELTKIGKYAFKGNKLAKLRLPKSLKIIGDGAFENNAIEELVLPESVTEVGKNAFSGNKLKSVTLLTKIKRLHKDVFANKKNALPQFPIFKVPTQEVLEWIVSTFTTTKDDGTKSIPSVKTTDEKSLKQEDITKYIEKARTADDTDDDDDGDDAEEGDDDDDEGDDAEEGDDDDGDGDDAEEGDDDDDEGDGAEEGDDDGDGAEEEDDDDGDDAEEGDDDDDEGDGAEEGDDDGDGAEEDDDEGDDAEEGDDDDGDGDDAEEGDDDDGDAEYDKSAKKAESMELLDAGVSKFAYFRDKTTGRFRYIPPLPQNVEAIYFLAAKKHNPIHGFNNKGQIGFYYLYKKDDTIRIKITFAKEVHIDNKEVEKFKKKLGSFCGGKPYITLSFFPNNDPDNDERKACVIASRGGGRKSLEFWYTVQDGDSTTSIHLGAGKTIGQHLSIKDIDDKNVSNMLEDSDPDDATTQKLYKIIIETTKPNVELIKPKVRICKKDAANKCSKIEKIFGINERIEVQVIFEAKEIQTLPNAIKNMKDSNNPYFTLYVGDKTIKAYYVDKQTPEVNKKNKKRKMIFYTLPKDEINVYNNPEGDISIAEDSFQLNGATIKDIANRNIDTTLKARTTSYKVVDEKKRYTRLIAVRSGYSESSCIEIEEILTEGEKKKDDECVKTP